jgi:hypothetical protein
VSFTGIPVKQNTVSFLRKDGELIMQYKGSYFGPRGTNEYEPRKIAYKPSSSDNWIGLVDSPINTAQPAFISDEFFDLMEMPDVQSFVFIMRWDRQPVDHNNLGQDLKVYYFNPNQTNALKNILSFVWPGVDKYPVPRIDQVSKDGKYVSFAMLGCWNCDGGQPETLVYNLDTNGSKRIGRVINFKWLENGKYEYKDYVEKPCAPDYVGIGPCVEDESKLPLKTGQL